MNPLVTVNILSYNRKDELRNTLQKVYEQDYKNIEVIVVDNASIDGSPEMVKSEFPDVILIELDKNIGIAGWNKGFEIAKGEYVLVLDDDSYPQDEAIKELLKVIQTEQSIGIVGAKILNTTYNFCETQNYTMNPLSFVGCGALIDKKKLIEVGYYDQNFFIYLNELELTARFIDNGFSVVYCGNAVIYHDQSSKSRGDSTNPFSSDYRYKNYFWGMSYFLMTKFPFQNILIFQTKWLLNRFIIALFHNKLLLFFKCLLDLIAKMGIIFSKRKILNNSTQKFYRHGNVFALVDRDYFPNFRKSI
ncbi:MAG: glycosyltransferase family 2 protein [Melioribacteraceae bacterium]|nr:glycosyltransferase family 2 protein [Melioribacteraceae bacterium]